ncbi:helix-turn-helix domain-containing protein [Eggerthella guodeyinii]|uniref:Helix-turn-helix domain-containing protein n=1 Tax=Eggerthella guodeyinii TaxID=2690837 RepID=A0A6N7RJL3_9ACTN|nr:helix-turn-helix transcriptional regulator [Eggerthella guodeyinii]MRX81100.1 helix-turn-helix domain-containing protein [Eggerthella guodeyinii]
MSESDIYIVPKRNLGLRIARMREQKGLSQRQYALQLELDRATLNQIEAGVGNPTFETLVRIADGLGAQVDDLFGCDEQLDD